MRSRKRLGLASIPGRGLAAAFCGGQQGCRSWLVSVKQCNNHPDLFTFFLPHGPAIRMSRRQAAYKATDVVNFLAALSRFPRATWKASARVLFRLFRCLLPSTKEPPVSRLRCASQPASHHHPGDPQRRLISTFHCSCCRKCSCMCLELIGEAGPDPNRTAVFWTSSREDPNDPPAGGKPSARDLAGGEAAATQQHHHLHRHKHLK